MTNTITLAAVFACITVVDSSCTQGGLRLVNGPTTNQGRVEVCVSQSWGTVCDDGFSTNDARVVCRQLGYNVDQPGTYTYKYSAFYGQGSGSIWLDDLSCAGNEQRLLDCTARPIGSHNCGHSEDVGVVCSGILCVTGNVRLIGGLVPTEGTVQMCVGGNEWRELCYSGWGYQEAFVVCRQLGLPATAATAVSGTKFSPRSTQSSYSTFRCSANESSLTNCFSSSSSCSSSSHRDAAVICGGDIKESCLHNGSIRLVGHSGPNTVEGRVEYCSNGVWGTIRSSGFDTRDGEVVCRQLGYQHPRVQIFSSNTFGRGSGPVLFNSLSCTGNELSIRNCPHLSQSYSYSHSSDIGIRCLNKVLTSCTNGAVRLMNGSTSDEGRVEVCINGEWGTVCDSGWYRSEAEVVCRRLGYNPSWALYYRSSRFGDGSLPVLAQSYSCTGTESSLTSCSGGTTGYSTCYYGRVAGVRCFSSTGCVNGTVRLVNGRRASEGSVQICVNGVWGHVCGDHWYTSEARVVCRQLGYSTTVYSFSYTLFTGVAPQPIIYDRISCTGSEQALSACSKNVHYYSICPITYIGGAVCEIPTNCTSGAVRLVNGSSDREGIVEVCYQGVWTTVDGYSWDYSDARVLCRQLGYHDKWAVAIRRLNSDSRNRIYFRYHCSGNKASLQSCRKTSSSIYAENWYNRPRGAVECQQMNINLTITCTMEGATRLVNGATEREGRVEVCQDGYWGTVCSDSWTEEDAYVVCRQTGLKTIRAITITDGRYGKGVGPVHMSSVRCDGHEMRLENCSHSNGVGVTNCHHGRDAGVLCEGIPTHYDVSIEASDEPYSIGSKNTMHCNVSPRPHQPVTYQWRTTAATGVILSDTSAVSPNATVVIQSSVTKYVYCYCFVKQTGTTIGTGVIRIVVNNILQPAVPVPLMATTGSDITLRVSVTETDRNTYLRELTWYHNGVKINQTSNTRLNLTSDNTSLSISSVTDSDSGQYSVQYDGLRLYPYDSGCERQALDLFRHYPLLAPAVLYLSTQERVIMNNTQLSPLTAWKSEEVFNKSTAFVTLGVNIDNYVEFSSVQWFQNGLTVSFSHESSFYPIKHPQAKLTIQNPILIHIGVYEIQLRRRLTCPSYTNLMGTSIAIIRANTQKLQYSETPLTEFTAESSSLPAIHTTTLTCTATGGYPPVDSITLYKNNELIMRTSSGVLQYNTTTSSQYGRYRCVIERKMNNVKKNLLLQEEATFNIMLQVDDCSMWTSSDVPKVEESLSKLFSSITSGKISFRNSLLTCSSSVVFKSKLIYSSDDGAVTASDLINYLKSRVARDPTTALTVDGTELAVLQVGEDQSNSSALVGLFFGGVGASTLIWIIIIVIIILLIFKFQKAKKQTSTISTSAEARYSSGAQVVKLSEDSQPPSSRPMTKPRPPSKTAVQNVSSPPVAPKKCSQNPSYGYTQGKQAEYDSNLYEAVDVRMSNTQEEYGGEYECF